MAAKENFFGHSSTGISPRPMLMGAPHNALRAFNAGVSLTLPMRHRSQAATLALQSGVDRSSVWKGSRPADLQQSSWRTGCMARHRQECIRLPYAASEKGLSFSNGNSLPGQWGQGKGENLAPLT